MGRPSFTSLLTVNGIDGTASGIYREHLALPSSKSLAQNCPWRNAQNTICDCDHPSENACW
jgi:hypothetical protein